MNNHSAYHPQWFRFVDPNNPFFDWLPDDQSHKKAFVVHPNAIMMLQWTYLITIAVVAFVAPLAKAQACIGTLADLAALQNARGKNISTPVTYVMCPNTVYLVTDYEYLELNGNASYLCGEDGSSANRCILRGGSLQMAIFYFSFDRSRKDNILVSGFTFEKADFFTASIAMHGRSTFRDCIFKVSYKPKVIRQMKNFPWNQYLISCSFLLALEQDHSNHGVFSFDFYLPPTLRRQLSSNGVRLPSWMHQVSLDHEELKKRSLLIGGGSEPRVTTSFENCQFLNNSLTTDIQFPLIAQNGVIQVSSAFADVSMNNCLFRDNNFDFRLGKVRSTKVFWTCSWKTIHWSHFHRRISLILV